MDQRGLFFAVLATLGVGLTPILAKKGLGGVSTFLAGTVSIAAGLFVFSVIMLFSGKFRNFFRESCQAILFMIAVGVSNTLAIAFLYTALSLSPAFIVAPLTSTYPLITIVLSYVFFRKGERLNRRILTGTFLIIGGTTLILFSK